MTDRRITLPRIIYGAGIVLCAVAPIAVGYWLAASPQAHVDFILAGSVGVGVTLLAIGMARNRRPE